MSSSNSPPSHGNNRSMNVELYVSTTSKKADNTPKKMERRQSVNRHGDPISLGLKQKPSWMGPSKNTGTSGPWRNATITLEVNEGKPEHALLHVQVQEETTPSYSIAVNKLQHADIRPVDTSLFKRPHCLSIQPSPARSSDDEPIYLCFRTLQNRNGWIALTKSYAAPEIYGQSQGNSDGGLYRMWRQLDITISAGHQLGIQKSMRKPRSSIGGSGDAPSKYEPEIIDIDAYCEIHLNGRLCARTEVNKGLGNPEWDEEFTFHDLSRLETLEVQVYRKQKLSKNELLGVVPIVLETFRRGETVNGKFPVVQPGVAKSDLQAGELSMQITVQEELVLPLDAYSDLLQTINLRNTLDWMKDLKSWMTDPESPKPMEVFHTQMMLVALSKGVLVEQILEKIEHEVESTPPSQPLFRGNTTMTLTLQRAMQFWGMDFLELTLGDVLRRICADKTMDAIAAIGNSERSSKEVDKGHDALVMGTRLIWESVYNNRDQIPREMRRIFYHIRQQVGIRNQRADSSDTNVPLQGVVSFFFLRFLGPAIHVKPHKLGLIPGRASPTMRKGLIQIAKLIQKLANLNEFEVDGPPQRFLREQRGAMVRFLEHISSKPGLEPTRSRSTDEQSFSPRGGAMVTLHRQAVPQLPHMLDLPRHLALVATAIVRAKKQASSRPARATDTNVDDFIARCIDIDARGVERVRQLDSRNQIPVVVRLSQNRVADMAFSAPTISNTPPHREITRASTPPIDRRPIGDLNAKTATITSSGGFMHNVLRKASKPDMKGASRRHPGIRSASTDSIPVQLGAKALADRAVTTQDLFAPEQPKRGLFNKMTRRP